MTFFSDKRSLFFIALLYFSDALLICSHRSVTDSFGWVSVIISGLISSGFVLLFAKISRHIGVGLFFLILSKTAAVIFITVSLFLFANFIQCCINMAVVSWLIPAFILLTAAFAAFKDFAIIKRSASILAAIIAVFLIFSLIILWNRIHFSNIYHLFQSRQSLFKQVIFYTAIFTIKGILLIEILRVENKMDNTDSRIVISAISISCVLIAAIQLITLTVLGDRLYSLIDYPIYYTLGLTRYGDYFERAEVISLAIFMITLTFKISVLMRLVFPHHQKKEQTEPASEESGASLMPGNDL